MIIYFADLLHAGLSRSYDHVPIAPGYLAAFIQKKFPDAVVEIFHEPEFFFNKLETEKPDIVGFSVYAWSEELVRHCSKQVKEISPETVTVAGGPSIDDIDKELKSFLHDYKSLDIAIPNEGEVSFARLVEHFLENKGLIPDVVIDGCARLSKGGELLRGKYVKPDLEELPSPYLEGWMDPFLEKGYLPVLQSMRGCPYACEFCVSGTILWNKLRQFDLKRVFAEFEYIKSRVKRRYLFLADENLGLLKERDIELAQYIRSSYDTSGYPAYIDSYTDKHPTDYVLNINKLFAPMTTCNISFQTLDVEAAKNVRRFNVKNEELGKSVDWAKKHNIPYSTEMIFGFPGETADGYISGLEWLIKKGFNRINDYQLRLLRGSDMFSDEFRAKHNVKTKFRMTENSFGRYNGEVIVDFEEIVVSSNSFSFDDYLRVREYGLFLYIALGAFYFDELIGLMLKLGLAGEKLVSYLACYDYSKYQNIKSLLDEYYSRTRGELYDSPEELTLHISSLIEEGQKVPATKLNIIFCAKIIFNKEARKELFEVVKEFVGSTVSDEKTKAFLLDYLENLLSKQIVDCFKGESEIIETIVNIDTLKLRSGTFDTVDDLIIPPTCVDLMLDDVLVEFINANPGDLADEEFLEDLMRNNMRRLKRNCKQVPQENVLERLGW